MADSKTLEKLKQQILAQGTASRWTGEGYGSAEANAADMAKILAQTGVTDINQFGKITKTIPAHEELQGGESGDVMVTVPEQTVTTFGNKLTGQEVPNTYSERQQGNFFGGTFAGKGNTGYGVQFDAKGNPIFYTQGASSNDLVNLLGDNKLLNAAAQLGAAYFGGPAGSAALNAAMGKSPADIAKAALLSYAGGQAANAVSGVEGITDILGKTGTDIASKAAGSFVTNEGKFDLEKFLLSQGLNYGKNALTSSLDGFNINPKDFTEGYFLPGGEGYIDPMSKTAGVTGSGYYDEITGQYIKDNLGGLQNPLGANTGNLDPNQKWEYNLVRPGVWANDKGEEIDLSYLPNSEQTMTGAEIMAKAGAMPNTNLKGSTTQKGSNVATPAASGVDLTSLLSMLGQGAPQSSVITSQDPYAHIKLMEELFGPEIDLTPTGDNTEQRK
jgi:hypothetical protein